MLFLTKIDVCARSQRDLSTGNNSLSSFVVSWHSYREALGGLMSNRTHVSSDKTDLAAHLREQGN